LATVLGSPVGQYPEQRHILRIEKWQDLVAQKVRHRESSFVRIHFGESDVGIGIDGDLLVDFTDAFDGADVAGVLAKNKVGMMAFDFSMGLLFFFGLFQGLDLGFGQNTLVLGRPFLQAF